MDKVELSVKGKTKLIPERHLWIFAHRIDFAPWWLQGGEVMVDENGEWIQNVFLGQGQDVGFDFEIVALWVEERVHRDLLNSLVRGERSRSYPGIELPEGNPIAIVTVKKVRH